MPKIHTRTEHYYLLSEIAAEVAAKTGESYSNIVQYVKAEFQTFTGRWPDYEVFEVDCAFEGKFDNDAYDELDALLQKCSIILIDV